MDAWTQRLEDIFVGKARDALDLALVDVKIRYPTLAIRPFKDMVGGMLMDVPGAGKSRYGTYTCILIYCMRYCWQFNIFHIIFSLLKDSLDYLPFD